MPPGYEHRQTSKLLLTLAALILAITTGAVLTGDEHWLGPVIGMVAALALALLARLTVHVDDHAIRLWFGPGLFRREFPLSEIQDVRRVRNPWYYGWGIRLFPGGVLYNVSGLDAVELTRTAGHRVRIGTDRPDDLARAITAARRT